MNENFKNSWSETLLVIGAGATKALGTFTTNELSEILRALAFSGTKNTDNIYSKLSLKECLISKVHLDEKDADTLASFLYILGDDLNSDYYYIEESNLNYAKKIFKNYDEKILKSRIFELRQEYDWNALKQIILICPFNQTNDNLCRDLFTLIDQKFTSHQGIKTASNFISYNRLIGARNCAILLINIILSYAWWKLYKNGNSENFEKYKKFTRTISRMMHKEGLKFQKYKLNSKEFFLSSLAVINFNFETIFEQLFLTANMEENKNSSLNSSPYQKLWLDFGIENKARIVNDDKSIGIKFSVDETACQRLNKKDARIINRVIKYLAPHGNYNWRECSACGSRFTFDASDFKLLSLGHIPPFPIPIFSNNDFHKSKKEELWLKKLRLDSLECPSCGAETFASSAPMIMQTMIKLTPTSFLDEIQKNVKICLKKARHIILFGYSLPTDDVLWQEAFAEAIRPRIGTTDAAYCSVIIKADGAQGWLYKEKLKSLKNSTVDNAIAIFGEDHVRAYLGGIPQVLGDASEKEICEILYPKWVNWKGTRLDN